MKAATDGRPGDGADKASLSPPIPVPDADSEGYWAAARAGTLAICRCVECKTWMVPPLERCRYCNGRTAFEEVSGRGVIFSYIVVRHQAVPGHQVPYVVGIVELTEQAGLRLSGVIQADPAAVSIGAPVRATMVDVGTSGFRAPEFLLVP